MERVCKDIVKAFPKGLYGHKTAENSSERGACPVHMRTKFKISFDPLLKNSQENAIDKL